ncbi:MAG: hypothetical protein CMH28_07410 [Micavibrio sp.]|nr:hypothetical protein [Micavibrio sp.]|tara:strand:- start:232 stop:633 length:402 start_codon:yes stop_codon:yes gene_type:complete
MTDKHTQTLNGNRRITLQEQDLKNFCGTEVWYRYPAFKAYLYTEGVQYVAEHGEAYWLLDKIFACHACVPKLSGEDFCSWELKKNVEGQGARLICTDGNYNELYSESILYTDFPLQSIKFYCVNDVLLLPSEY